MQFIIREKKIETVPDITLISSKTNLNFFIGLPKLVLIGQLTHSSGSYRHLFFRVCVCFLFLKIWCITCIRASSYIETQKWLESPRKYINISSFKFLSFLATSISSTKKKISLSSTENASIQLKTRPLIKCFQPLLLKNMS